MRSYGVERFWSGLLMASGLAFGCDSGEVKVARKATALVHPMGPELGNVEILGATDWRAAGRAPLELTILLDGEPVGFMLGQEPVPTFENGGISFGTHAGTYNVALAKDDEVIWDFGEHTIAAGTVTTLVYFGTPEAPRAMALADDLEVPEGHVAARLVNLDSRQEAVDAVLCPAGTEDLSGCETVATGLGYGERWEGFVPEGSGKVLLWERARPEGFPHERFVGGGGWPLGGPGCQVSTPVRETATLITTHIETPAESPECAWCSSGWSFGAGRSPGDCAW